MPLVIVVVVVIVIVTGVLCQLGGGRPAGWVPVVPGDDEGAVREKSVRDLKEPTARDGVVTHLLPDFAAARPACLAGHEADADHLLRPLAVMVGPPSGLAEVVLPLMRLLVRNDLEDEQEGVEGEVLRVQRDLIGRLAIPGAEACGAEVAAGAWATLQRDQAVGQLTVEQFLVEHVDGELEFLVGLGGRTLHDGRGVYCTVQVHRIRELRLPYRKLCSKV